MSLGHQATTSKGDEVGEDETQDVDRHLLNDCGAFCARVAGFDMPDWRTARVATVTNTRNEPSPDHMRHIMRSSLEDNASTHDHGKDQHGPSATQFLAHEESDYRSKETSKIID